MSLFWIIALPCALMGLVFFLSIKTAYHSHSSSRPLFLYPLIFSFFITGGYIIWGYYAICTSKSSTAAIGLLFVPLISIIVTVVGFLFSWSCFYVARFILERLRLITNRITSILPLVLAIVLIVLTGYVAQDKLRRHRLLNTAASGTNAGLLTKILDDGISSQDLEALSKLAKNPNTKSGDLASIYGYCKHSITEFNPPEIPVFISLAQNPQTPPRILVVLAGCQQSAVRYGIAINPNTPTKTLIQLAEDRDALIKKYAQTKLRSRKREE